MNTSFARIGVAGAGAWGVALSNAAAAAGRDVVLWGRDGAAMAQLQQTRQSPRLPGFPLAPSIRATAEIGALAASDAILIATPAQATRAAALQLATQLASPAPLVVCAKGIELGTLLFMTDVLAEAAPGWPRAILSGPSFAADVAAGLPTAVTLAAYEAPLAAGLAEALKGPSLRLYHTQDVRGVEIGGAAKNVLAIACGASAGLRLGPSASAALIARGFAELRRFGEAFGAQAQTLMGLSGLGDLVLTCSSTQSRNFAFGLALGQGLSPGEASGGKLAEGSTTTAALMTLARRAAIDMPVAAMVERVLEGGIDARSAVDILLARPQKRES